MSPCIVHAMMRFHYLLQADMLEPGDCLKYVVGGIYRILQEEFGERNTEIFWEHDKGTRVNEIASIYHLTPSRVRQIISVITRYIDRCFSVKHLRILPLIHLLQTKDDEVKQILLSAGYTIDTLPEHTLVKGEQQILPAKQFKTELDKLNLNTRCMTVLHKCNIYTVEDLCALTLKQLQFMRGLGTESLEHIQLRLREHGLSLKD